MSRQVDCKQARRITFLSCLNTCCKLIALTILICTQYACRPNAGMPISSSFPTEWDSHLFASGKVSTMLNERDMNISSDGQHLYFTRGTADNQRRCLMHSKWVNGEWSEADILPFSGTYQDIEAFLSPDGTKLFFASDRPLESETEAGDYNIWCVEIKGDSWGNPYSLSSLVNSPADEFYPSVSNSGNLYFTADYSDGIGLEDIYVSYFWEGKYQKPTLLDSSINTKSYEFNAYISPDETLILYSSYGRPDDMGGGDIYINARTEANAPWSAPQHLNSPINSSALDYCPFVDQKKEYLYFTSNRKALLPDTIRNPGIFDDYHHNILNGTGNIFRVPFNSIKQ